MVDLSTRNAERIAAPPLAPVNIAIDLVHLSRMSLGERELEREVLVLFDHQAGMLLTRMRGVGRAEIAAFAHTLKGSARGIGAWSVAEAAEGMERAASDASDAVLARAFDRLEATIQEVQAEIRWLVETH